MQQRADARDKVKELAKAAWWLRNTFPERLSVIGGTYRRLRAEQEALSMEIERTWRLDFDEEMHPLGHHDRCLVGWSRLVPLPGRVYY